MNFLWLGAGLLVALVFAHGVDRAVETAVSCAQAGRLRSKAGGSRAAASALAILDAPARYLTAVSLGTQTLSLLAISLVGAFIGEFLPGWEGSEVLALAGLSLFACLVLIVFGDLIPRRIVALDPERALCLLAGPIRAWTRVVGFLAAGLNGVGEGILRLLRVKPSNGGVSVTPETIGTLIEQGAKAGVFDQAEQEMVERVLRLGDRRVSLIMTPRAKVLWLDIADDPATLREKLLGAPHSRFPVCEGTLDNVVGVVHVKDLLVKSLLGEPVNLRGFVQLPELIPDSVKILQVLDLFKRPGIHMALVLDEFGGVSGLVTITDVLEAIVGDLPSGLPDEEPLAVQREDGSWLLDGVLGLDEFKELFGLSRLPGEDRGEFMTLAGFLITQMGHIPAIAEVHEWDGLCFEVMDTDGRKVDRILVRRIDGAR